MIKYTTDSRLVSFMELFLDYQINAQTREINTSSMLNSPTISKSVSIFSPNFYVYYQIDGIYYVDINHIANRMQIDADTLSCHTTKTLLDFRYDGAIIKRDLIDLVTLNKIMFAYDCSFCNTFRYEFILFLLLRYMLDVTFINFSMLLPK